MTEPNQPQTAEIANGNSMGIKLPNAFDIREILAIILAWLDSLFLLPNQPPRVAGPIDWIKDSLTSILKSIITPPDIDDAPALRAWLIKMAGYVQYAADWTSTTIDNQVLKLAMMLVNSDVLWPELYALIHMMPHDCDNVVMQAKADSPEVFEKAKLLADKVGVDPMTIISIVMAVIKLISIFRK